MGTVNGSVKSINCHENQLTAFATCHRKNDTVQTMPRNVWLQACWRKVTNVNKYTRECKGHFLEETNSKTSHCNVDPKR